MTAPLSISPCPTDNPRRIALFINSIMMGGAEEHVRRLALGLRRRGMDVLVIMSETSAIDDLAHSLSRDDIRVERLTLALQTNRRHAISRFRRYVSILRDFGPDVLHVHMIGYTGGRWAVLGARLSGIKSVVCTMHIAPREPQSTRIRWDRALQSMLVDRYVAVSGDNAKCFVAHLGMTASKVMMIPNAVDLNSYSGDPALDRERIRTEIGIPQDAPVVGVVGRLDSQKGLPYLLSAMPGVVEKFPEVRLILAGDGALLEQLTDQVRTLGLEDVVRFIGYRRDIPALLRAFDILAMPSLYEGLPLSLLEAMAASLPVLATTVGGIPEVVEDGVSGRLVPPADAPALAASLLDMLRNFALTESLGREARKTAQGYSEDALLDRMTSLYRELCVRKRGSRETTAAGATMNS